MSLPYFLTDNRQFGLMQNAWKEKLEPLLENPVLQGTLLKNVSLINGTNTVNHLLGRKPQGYIVTDANAAAVVYRSLPFNALTLTLVSDAAAIVSLYVF